MPELVARAAPEVQLAGLARALERERVHVRERQHLAAAPVLHDARHQAALVVDDQLVDPRRRLSQAGATRSRGGRAGVVGAPVTTHRDRQREMDGRAELAFELAAGGVPIDLIMRPPRADDDPLLGLGLDPARAPRSASGPRRAVGSTPRSRPRPRAAAPGGCAAAPARGSARRALIGARWSERCAARRGTGSRAAAPTRCSTSAARPRRCAPRPGRSRAAGAIAAAASSACACAALGERGRSC